MSEKYERIDDELLAEKINRELDDNRPKWKDFAGVYTEEKINADKAKLAEYRERKGIEPAKERSKLKDGLLIEKMFLDIENKDYFDEGSLYDELLTDEDDLLLFAFPAHEFDDTFNNVDMVCQVRNSLTDHKTIMFAVDCTSNSTKVEDKMNYRRTADEITGFTDLEYFRDTASFGGSGPCKIEKVPRFVVGFDAELAREIVTSDYNDWTKEELDAKYDQVSYYLLTELVAQAKLNDTGLDKYFGRLLKHFIDTHDEFDISLYPKDAVMEEVIMAVDKKQENGP